jgi:hypothetical protein
VGATEGPRELGRSCWFARRGEINGKNPRNALAGGASLILQICWSRYSRFCLLHFARVVWSRKAAGVSIMESHGSDP